jgi:hypothetical protein
MKDNIDRFIEEHAERTSTWMQKTGGFAKDMTLRDEFAGRALQALIPLWHAEHRAGDLGDGTEDWDYFYESFSREAYEMADEMLKAREK